MTAFTRCTSGHWNALGERWNVGEWSRACCGNRACAAPLEPSFTYAPPDVAMMPVGQLGRVEHTRFQQCAIGHWNVLRRHLLRPVCGAPGCRRQLQDVPPRETFESETAFHAPREDVHEHAVRQAAAALQGPENALMLAANFLGTRDRARLSGVNRALQGASRAAGYDPFGGEEVLGRVDDGPLRQTVLLQDLAKHAFNHLYRMVRSNVGFRRPLREGDEAVRQWSLANSFGSSGRAFIAGNCRACAVVGGHETNAVNFIRYGRAEQDRLINALDLANQPALPLQRYDRTSHQHAEVRLAEAQDDLYTRGEISVDKLCCLFCAAQMEALGRSGDIAGAATGTLNWYVFSRYVMYFRTRREVMWGREVERAFTLLSPADRIEFLRILAALAASHRFGSDQEYQGLPPIEQVIAELS